MNRPFWDVIEDDVAHINGFQFSDVDLLAGGVPCPPFSIAGKQLGSEDERDLTEPISSARCRNSATRVLGACSRHQALAFLSCVRASC
jgi:hypothetical protein